MKKIAILGSTGHIARGLIDNLAGQYDLFLFSRSKDKPLDMFPYGDYDVVINCIGVREKLWTDPYEIFRITETFDSICLDYLRRHAETLYINFSSGAVFGQAYDHPVYAQSRAIIPVNDIADNKQMFYGIAKLNAEAKHRALGDMNIVDIRVFSYASEYLRPDSLSILNEIFDCIREGRELITSPQDFYRDYIHPKDLAQLVRKCIAVQHINAPLDAYSRRPCRKFEMLDYFVERYGLRYRTDEDWKETSPTGPKTNYYSNDIGASEIGYAPQYDSMEAIAAAAEKIITNHREGHL